MYQRVVIVGNLGRDPEMRYTANGTPVCNFTVATNRRWTDQDGSSQEETTWFRVSVFGRQAEICNQYLSKGRMVLCDGEVGVATGQACVFYHDGEAEGRVLGGGWIAKTLKPAPTLTPNGSHATAARDLRSNSSRSAS